MAHLSNNATVLRRIVSGGIVLYLAVQVYVGFAQVESFPFTHGPMFANAPPPDRPAKRYRFEGIDASGRELDIVPADFNRMKRSVIRAWIKVLLTASEGRNPVRFCTGLMRAYDTRKSPADWLVELRVVRQLVVSSGSGSDEIVDETTIHECSVAAESLGLPQDQRAFQVLTPLDQAIVIEAEAFTEANAGTGRAAASRWEITQAYDGASAGWAVEWIPNVGVATGDETIGPRLDYRIDFAEAGTYHVWIRMLGRTTSDDSVHAGLDGEAATLGNAGMTDVSGEWHWEGRAPGRDGDPWVTVNVEPAGPHVFNVWMREDGTVIDQILLTTDPRLRPMGVIPANGRER